MLILREDRTSIPTLHNYVILKGTKSTKFAQFLGFVTKLHPRKKEEASHEKKKENYIYTFKPLITNISGTNASRFLKVTVSVQFEDKELEKVFDEKNAIFLDAMNSIFSSLTLEQATEIIQRETLKRDIRDKINDILAEVRKPQVKNIFFNEYICQ